MAKNHIERRLVKLSERIKDSESIHEVERLRREQDKQLDALLASPSDVSPPGRP